MPAYWIARARVIDPMEYNKYVERVPSILANYGGKILARGGRFAIMEGTDHFARFVVVEFPTLEKARECHESPAYQEAAKFRQGGAGDVDLIIVEGV